VATADGRARPRQLGAALALAGQLRGEIEALPGLHVLHDEFLGAEASHDLDPLHLVIDVSGLGATGYDAADWLREHHRLDMGLSDHRRVEATISVADDGQTPPGCWQRSPPWPATRPACPALRK
jgi:arginine/lysine/ornithine decarboxylase